jgi:hypothetical protein
MKEVVQSQSQPRQLNYTYVWEALFLCHVGRHLDRAKRRRLLLDWQDSLASR